MALVSFTKPKTMKNLIYVLLIFLFVSCSSNEKEQYDTRSSVIKTITTPIYAGQDKTEVVLTDYITDVTIIDSITYGNGVTGEEIVDNNESIEIILEENAPFVSLITLWTDGIRNDIPVYKSMSKTIPINYYGDANNENVQLKGEFTNWAPVDLEKEGNRLVYHATVPQGKFQYIFMKNGQEELLSGQEEDVVSNGMGGFNRVLDNSRKAAPARLQYGEVIESGFTFNATGQLDNVLVLFENQLIDFQKEGNRYQVKLPKKDFTNNIHHTQLVRVFASDNNGRSNDLLIPVQDGHVVTEPSRLTRSDFHNQVLYFMMVDRFLDGDTSNTKPVDDPEILPQANYKGGDLSGVLQKLKEGYFSKMGINTIWLSPITQNPEGAYGLWPEPKTKFSGYHGYWPVSNTKIDYRFGDEKTLKALIDEAHKQDVNVILDYVANHVHKEHPVYLEHPEWATDLYLPDGSLNTERWDDHRLTTWFDTFMPTLDLENPEVTEVMVDSALHWVTNYQLDGFRHDATKHVPELYWRTLTKKIKEQTNRPIYQIGETYGSYDLIRSYVSTGMLDAQFDFNMYDAAVSAFAKADNSYGNLTEILQKGLDYYGYHHLMGNISGNQDRARFISYASGDVKFEEDAKAAGWTRDIGMSDESSYGRLAMLHAFNMTIPGVPVIYYGDEYGSIGANDPDNRRMMKFDNLSSNEQELKNQVKSLVYLRRNSMSLLYGDTEILSDVNGILGIKRTYFNETTYIFFNENKISLNAYKRNDKEEVKIVINGIEDPNYIQVKPQSFTIVQTKKTPIKQ